MSARNPSQSDTSRAVVKNPLFSAVAGTIDDFVNNSILLPAAEIPLQPSPPPPPPPASIEDTREPQTRDSTKSVIYGSEPPAILDCDKFSEISLDQPSDVEPPSITSREQHNPLQNLDTFSSAPENNNNRDELSFNPLLQATAFKDSLSQLPGVASSVLSSFSSILKGTSASPSPPNKYDQAPSESLPTQLTQNQETASSTYPYQYFYDQSAQSDETPAVVPTFYSPADTPLLRPESSLSPSTEGQNNNLYRLKERRKFYAPIPGLNANDSSVANLTETVVSSAPPPVTEQNQQKSNSSFSLGSFFGAPLLDKLQNTVLSKGPEPQAAANEANNFYQPPSNNNQIIDFSASPVNPTQFYNPNQEQQLNQQIYHQAPSTLPAAQQSIQQSHLAAAPVVLSSVSSNSSNVPLGPNQSYSYSEQASRPTTFNLFPSQSSSQTAPVAVNTVIQSNLPTAPPLTPSPLPSFVSVQQSQIPSLYLPPTAVSSNLLPSSLPPPPPQALNFATPPVGQSQLTSNYRLKGKPLYRKLPPTSSYNTVQQPVGQAPTQLFNPPTVQTTAIPNVHIFNPLAATNYEQPSISANNLPPPLPITESTHSNQTQIFNPPTAATIASPTVSVFNPFIDTAPIETKATQERATVEQLNQPQIFNPSVAVTTSPNAFDSSVDQVAENRPISTSPSIASIPNVSIFNPLSVNQEAELSETKEQIQSFAPPYLTSFFGQNTEPKTSHQVFSPNLSQATQISPSKVNIVPAVTPPFQSHPPIKVSNPFLSSELKSEKSQTKNPPPTPANDSQIFAPFEPTPPFSTSNLFNSFATNNNNNQAKILNPFQQTKDTFDTTAATEKISQPLDNVNAALKILSLDTENNPIEEETDKQRENINLGAPVDTLIDPISFFNNNNRNENEQGSASTANANEFQIQNFFNNPPPLPDTQESVQDKNFNFIGTNLLNKRIERIAKATTAATIANDSTDNLSIASYIAEPASSAQSEFSEYAEPPIATDVTTRTESFLLNNQDQTDGLNPFSFSSNKEPTNMGNVANEQTATPTTTNTNIVYRPVYKHWFYKNTVNAKIIWTPFSFVDSMLLEEVYISKEKEIVITDGGRYDVNIPQRTRTAAYWTAVDNEVRRCSWFYKGADFRLIPYEENVAEQLENEYREASNSGEWQRKIPLTSGETVVFNGPSDMLHYLQSQSPDGWNSTAQNGGARPRSVKRGIDEFTIDDGEPEQVDHLLFMVHGIGSACDLKFRKVDEVVDDFRNIALQLVQSHYRSSCDRGVVGRVEVLPISWYSELHSVETGIDEKIKSITLESIPKLRNFTNSTLLDVFFYMSPVFCQQIIDAVAGNMNNSFAKFCERNPNFHGNVSVSGHSLGSVILFDLLQHQRAKVENSENLLNASSSSTSLSATKSHVKSPLKRNCSQQINYMVGNVGTGQPFISYPQLSFQPTHFFAFGSPIGMFITIRGIDTLGIDFKLPTTGCFFNIFHPYDPVAYRMEALVNPELASLRPVLIPHHKGRKRMHLELRETMNRVGGDIKQKIMQTFQKTLNTVYSYTSLQKHSSDATKEIQQEVDKVIEEELSLGELENTATASSGASSEIDAGETNLDLGKMNRGRRIDYVLQEAPIEMLNDYVFALVSHVCYWTSEDSTLFIMKEIYSALNIQADNKIPQQSMTIERPSPSNSVSPSAIS